MRGRRRSKEFSELVRRFEGGIEESVTASKSEELSIPVSKFNVHLGGGGARTGLGATGDTVLVENVSLNFNKENIPQRTVDFGGNNMPTTTANRKSGRESGSRLSCLDSEAKRFKYF